MSLLEAALGALEEGGVVGLPTDTLYGIGADPWREGAVARLFSLKRRPDLKPIPVLAAELGQLEGLARFSDRARRAGERHWPGPLTLVLERTPILPTWLGDPTAGTIAVRVPDHPVALGLLGRWGPLAVTSANLSGQPAASNHEEAAAAFGSGVAVYLPGVAGGGAASTVVDMIGSEPKVLRHGPVAEEDV